MSDISQQDLDVRLQLSGCKYSELANTYANDLKYGKKCATTNGRNLALLNAYIELMECYNVNTEEVLSEGSFQITTLTIGFSLEILIDGVVIFPSTVSITSNRNLAMEALVTYINTNQSVYTATLDTTNDLYVVRLTGPCTGGDITYVTDADKGEIALEVTDLTGGVCAATSDNCLTEDQMNTMFDSISKLTKICFQPLGYTYTE